MQIQLTIPTEINERELAILIQKIKKDKKILIGDWELEKVLRFEIKDDASKQNIQLSSKKANITFESDPVAIKIAIEFLRPFFELLLDEKPNHNFLRFTKITPEEFVTYENFKMENPEETLIDIVKALGIPNKNFYQKLLEAVVKSGNIAIKNFKNFLERYNNPSIPKCYIEILKMILQ
ncbi:MAG: hypothetical protein QXS37_03415 [Candidatus Aenigmatarchaeota archaeon]